MPRIPVRVEPYSSPSRQHRHYKNKRDQVLRALGKAAYINGSHFAIMWVSARGDVETYASEALQSRLDDWFVKGGIADEAKELVKASGVNRGGEITVFEDSDDDVEREGSGEVEIEPEEDVFVDSANIISSGATMGKGKAGKPLAPLNTQMANQHFLRSRSSWAADENHQLIAPRSAPLFPSSAPFGASDDVPRTSTPLLAATTSSRLVPRNVLSASSSSLAPTYEVTLSTHSARTAFLELRFGQLQQGVCKTVAKAWIKIIEPKKQTRCPYNKGEAGKPEWWPAGVRHKEPDHLMKPERHALLLTILRSPKVKVARLQLATAEVVALIKADKVSLLMDVYRIAREEEKIRERREKQGESAEEAGEVEVKVGVSTLEGWSREESGPTVQGRQIARSVTPELATSSATAGENRKKRPATAAMAKSSSLGNTTALNAPNKRRSFAATGSKQVANGLGASSIGYGSSTFGMHEHGNVIGLGLLPPTRSHSFSAASTRTTSLGYANAGSANTTASANSACTSTDTSPWPTTYNFTEVNGLVTPLTASGAIDPAFNVDLLHHPSAPAAAHATNSHGSTPFFYTHPPSFYSHPGAQVPHPHHNHTDTSFESNALGLNLTTPAEGWNFGALDMSHMSQMPDLTNASWQSSTDASFSLDSLGPAPATPGLEQADPCELRLNLPTAADAKRDHHQQGVDQLHPDVASQQQQHSQHADLWLPHQHQHNHHQQQQQHQPHPAAAEWTHHHNPHPHQQQLSQSSTS